MILELAEEIRIDWTRVFHGLLTIECSCRNPLKTTKWTDIKRCKREQVGEIHTFTMDPHKGTRRSPFLKGAALSKPRCGPVMVLFERDVVIC